MTKRALGAVAALVVVLLAAAVVVTWRRAEPTMSSPASASTSSAPVVEKTAAGPSSSPVAVAAALITKDPNRYAAAVAAVVFGMDPRGSSPAEYRAMLLALADPRLSTSGHADLERTIDARVPAWDQWARMRANEQYATWQTSSVLEPGTWAQVITDGQAEPGWTLRNVTGLQTTHYLDGGAAKVAVRERTVTIGMRCPAPGADVDRCGLLLIGTTVLS